MVKRLRNAFVTINNYTDEDINACKGIESTYRVIGYEGKDKTPHLHMYIELSKQTAFTALKKQLPRANIQPRLGTAQQAADYCKKGDMAHDDFAGNDNYRHHPDYGKNANYEEEGELSRPGKRSDLDKVRDAIKQEPTIKRRKLLEEHPKVMAYCPRFVEMCKEEYRDCTIMNYEDKDSPHLWVWGPSGTGKTSSYHTPGTFIKLPDNKWWDGYDGEEQVLIDDVSPKTMECLKDKLKNWIDRYPFRAEIKGGTIFIRPKRIIVTSNYSPEECFTHPEDLKAIRRKMTIIHKAVLGGGLVSIT